MEDEPGSCSVVRWYGAAPSGLGPEARLDLVRKDVAVKPERLWWWSTRLHRRGLTPVAKLLKALNFFLFKAVLPYECDIQRDITLWHRGVATVIHPNTRIGHGVYIGHGVTVSVHGQEPGDPGVVIEDGVKLGVGSMIASRKGEELVVGAGAEVGAHAMVTRSVKPGARMVGPKATDLSERQGPRP